ERITWAMNAINGEASDADKEKYYQIVRWAAEHGMTVTMHWGSDKNVNQLLTIWERVNREFPIAGLRWTVAHLNDGSPATFARMKAMGVGWTVQDAMYNPGDQTAQQDAAAARRMPPVNTAKKMGIMIAGGTDAHRVSTYNPFTVLEWFLDGKTASGAAIRGPE